MFLAFSHNTHSSRFLVVLILALTVITSNGVAAFAANSSGQVAKDKLSVSAGADLQGSSTGSVRRSDPNHPAAGSPRIAFGSVRNGGNHDVFLMDLDGSNQIRLTNNLAYDDQPKWSPDGTKIAFMSDRDGNFEIYTMNADGSGQTRITNNFAADGFPAWSHDGTKIAFVRGDLRNPSTFEIFVMNANGSNQIQLTNDSVIDGVPSWSPDNQKIVFMSGGSSVFAPNSFEIFAINADGSSRTRLTNGICAALEIYAGPSDLKHPGTVC